MLEDDALRLARELAEYRGMSLSAWFGRAVRNQVFQDNALRACDEVEAEIGPFPEDAVREADEALDAMGVPRLPE